MTLVRDGVCLHAVLSFSFLLTSFCLFLVFLFFSIQLGTIIQQVAGISIDTGMKGETDAERDFKFDKFRVNDIGATPEVIELRREVPVPHFGTRATYNVREVSTELHIPHAKDSLGIIAGLFIPSKVLPMILADFRFHFTVFHSNDSIVIIGRVFHARPPTTLSIPPNPGQHSNAEEGHLQRTAVSLTASVHHFK